MLITNGTKTRNIASEKLPEYQAKGYWEAKNTTEKPKAPQKPKKISNGGGQNES